MICERRGSMICFATFSTVFSTLQDLFIYLFFRSVCHFAFLAFFYIACTDQAVFLQAYI